MNNFWQYLLIFPAMAFCFWLIDTAEELLRKLRLENDKKEQELNEKK